MLWLAFFSEHVNLIMVVSIAKEMQRRPVFFLFKREH